MTQGLRGAYYDQIPVSIINVALLVAPRLITDTPVFPSSSAPFREIAHTLPGPTQPLPSSAVPWQPTRTRTVFISVGKASGIYCPEAFRPRSISKWVWEVGPTQGVPTKQYKATAGGYPNRV